VGSTPEEFAARIRNEIDVMAKLSKTLGIVPE
jgi:tripartite-type tricarboxylate transporter receptor subunit TctC